MECAPWWGGVFECMIRSTECCLCKVVGSSTFSQDKLLIAVGKIEVVVNSRPLSYIPSADYKEPLTPSHILVGRRLLNLPYYLGHFCVPGDGDFEVNASQLTRQTKYFANVLIHFWKRWRSEYLNELREVHYHLARKTLTFPSLAEKIL